MAAFISRIDGLGDRSVIVASTAPRAAFCGANLPKA